MLLTLGSKRAIGQAAATSNADGEAGRRTVALVKEFKNAFFYDVSADSKRLCLYFSRYPGRSFRWNGTKWTESRAPIRRGDGALRVVDASTLTPIYETGLPATPSSVTFFRDGNSLCVEIPGAGAGIGHILIDLQDGKLVEQVEPSGRGQYFEYLAIDGRTVLGSLRDERANRAEFLVKAEAPEYNELVRVPFTGDPARSNRSIEASATVSSDRRFLVYAYDSTVVYRSTESLERLWSWTGEQKLPVWRVGISADGKTIAAAAADTVAVGYSKEHYVAVLGGRDGKELIRLPALATECVAVSPDGRTVAAGRRVRIEGVPGRAAGTQPTVTLFDVTSGRELDTVTHDRFYGGGKEFLYAGVRSTFTPDGDYLITSGLNTKIWKVQRS